MAKIFLSSTDTEYNVGNSDTLVYGDSTNNKQKIILAADVSAITLDANVDGLQLSGNQADYTFQQAGNALKILKGDVLVSTVDIQDDTDGSQFVFADKSIAAKPVFDLTKGGLYFDVGGVTVSGSSTVTTPSNDATAPKVVSLTPTDNSQNVLVGANLQITFDEPIKAGSGYIVINGADARVIDIKDSKQISISGNTLTINPTADLKASSFYSVQVGKDAITDLAGNKFAGITDDQAFNFKTDVGLALTGRAIDGYLQGSTVSITDRFGKVYTATTDKDGKYSFPAGTPEGSMTVKGGTDASTGKAFKGVLKAPEGAKVITPLTTLVQGFIEKGKSPEAAQEAVGKALGFDATKVDLANLDPIQAVISSKALENSSEKALFGQIMASTAKMANFLVMGAATLQGATKADVDLEDLTDSLIGSLLDKMDAPIGGGTTGAIEGTVFDFDKPELLQSVFMDSANFGGNIEFDLGKMENIADNFGSMMADFSGKMDASFTPDADPLAFLADLGQILSFAQNDAAEQLFNFAQSGENFDVMMGGFIGDAADKFINDVILGSEFLDAMGDTLGDFYADEFDFAGLGLGEFDPNALPEDGILPPLTPEQIQDILDDGGDDYVYIPPTTSSSDTLDATDDGLSDDANDGVAFTYNVSPGTYTYTIQNFTDGDKLAFPVTRTPTVINRDFTDGEVDLSWAYQGSHVVITLTGLDVADDAALLFLSSFDTVFNTANTIA